MRKLTYRFLDLHFFLGMGIILFIIGFESNIVIIRLLGDMFMVSYAVGSFFVRFHEPVNVEIPDNNNVIEIQNGVL